MIYVGDTLYFQVALSNKLANYSSIYWSFCAFFFWSPWIGCLLYFYNSRGAFQPDSSNPVSSRPLDISGFVVSGISVESPYTITLSPIDREDVRQPFELLCDTIHEMRCLEFLYALWFRPDAHDTLVFVSNFRWIIILFSPFRQFQTFVPFTDMCLPSNAPREWSKALIQEGKGEKDTSKQWGWQVVEWNIFCVGKRIRSLGNSAHLLLEVMWWTHLCNSSWR